MEDIIIDLQDRSSFYRTAERGTHFYDEPIIHKLLILEESWPATRFIEMHHGPYPRLLEETDSNGDTPLMVVLKKGKCDDMLDLLDSHGIEVDAQNGRLLDIATSNGCANIVKKLMWKGAKPTMDTFKTAINGDHASTLKVLLENHDGIIDAKSLMSWKNHPTIEHVLKNYTGPLQPKDLIHPNRCHRCFTSEGNLICSACPSRLVRCQYCDEHQEVRSNGFTWRNKSKRLVTRVIRKQSQKPFGYKDGELWGGEYDGFDEQQDPYYYVNQENYSNSPDSNGYTPSIAQRNRDMDELSREWVGSYGQLNATQSARVLPGQYHHQHKQPTNNNPQEDPNWHIYEAYGIRRDVYDERRSQALQQEEENRRRMYELSVRDGYLSDESGDEPYVRYWPRQG